MKKNPKISIVTPSYNMARFFEKTVQSVLIQNYFNFEYIIIDGGSTDESADIIKKYEQHITYWVSEPDQGQSDAINKGFNRATGELSCWLNSDDVLLPGALKRVAEVYSKNPDMDIITGNVVYIDKNDRIIKSIRVPRQDWFFYKHGVGFFQAPAIFFKSSLYQQVGGVNVNLHYCMDIDLWHKFRLKNAKVYHINEYLGAFRIHRLSKTGAFYARKSSKIGASYKKNKKIFENPETTILRKEYIPNVSKNTIRVFRFLYKFRQLINLNYLRGWIDLQKYKKKTWQEIFK